MAATDSEQQRQYPILYPAVAVPLPQGIPTEGPASHPQGPPIPYELPPVHFSPSEQPHLPPQQQPQPQPPMNSSPKQEYYAPPTTHIFPHIQPSVTPPSPSADQQPSSSTGGAGANHYPSSSGVPRLPPILQVEKQQVTTSATQIASASRRRNEAHFVCPVPGCGSTFTRRFNLRGHLRSHTEERPYVCDWPGCKKGFARQHDCKRHQALHAAKTQSNICQGCKKTFSRLDALNRHLRSDGGADCRAANPKFAAQMEASQAQGQQASQAQLPGPSEPLTQTPPLPQPPMLHASHSPSPSQSNGPDGSREDIVQ